MQKYFNILHYKLGTKGHHRNIRDIFNLSVNQSIFRTRQIHIFHDIVDQLWNAFYWKPKNHFIGSNNQIIETIIEYDVEQMKWLNCCCSLLWKVSAKCPMYWIHSVIITHLFFFCVCNNSWFFKCQIKQYFSHWRLRFISHQLMILLPKKF